MRQSCRQRRRRRSAGGMPGSRSWRCVREREPKQKIGEGHRLNPCRTPSRCEGAGVAVLAANHVALAIIQLEMGPIAPNL